MNFHKFRIQIALVAFLVAVAIGLGANYLYEQTQVIKPLNAELQDVPGISSVNVEKNFLGNGARTLVQLGLESDILLSEVFADIHYVLEETRGNFALQLEDSADEELISLFDRIQIAAEEAIVTGEFTALEERVQELAENEGVDWKLAIDRDFIYLSLLNGESSLQRVIGRGLNEGKVIIYTGGGIASG